VRFVNRPEGSGTRMLTELMLAKLGILPAEINGYASTEVTHAAVAAYIASGMADVGVGVQTAAQRFGLHFMPLLRERYYLALPTALLQQPSMRRALALMQSPRYRSSVASLVGYEAAETGKVLSIEEALPSS